MQESQVQAFLARLRDRPTEELRAALSRPADWLPEAREAIRRILAERDRAESEPPGDEARPTPPREVGNLPEFWRLVRSDPHVVARPDRAVERWWREALGSIILRLALATALAAGFVVATAWVSRAPRAPLEALQAAREAVNSSLGLGHARGRMARRMRILIGMLVLAVGLAVLGLYIALPVLALKALRGTWVDLRHLFRPSKPATPEGVLRIFVAALRASKWQRARNCLTDDAQRTDPSRLVPYGRSAIGRSHGLHPVHSFADWHALAKLLREPDWTKLRADAVADDIVHLTLPLKFVWNVMTVPNDTVCPFVAMRRGPWWFLANAYFYPLIPMADGKASALVEAVVSQAPDRLRALLAHGGDPNTLEPNEGSLLHLAARRGFADVTAVLLESGADPHPGAGLAAAHRGHTETVRVLLDSRSGGAVLDALWRDRSRFSPELRALLEARHEERRQRERQREELELLSRGPSDPTSRDVWVWLKQRQGCVIKVKRMSNWTGQRESQEVQGSVGAPAANGGTIVWKLGEGMTLTVPDSLHTKASHRAALGERTLLYSSEFDEYDFTSTESFALEVVPPNSRPRGTSGLGE
jgi:hypothetical protein